MNKKKIAAITAVIYYLQAKLKSDADLAALHKKNMESPRPVGFWSYSGRNIQMLDRRMIQMRQLSSWNK